MQKNYLKLSWHKNSKIYKLSNTKRWIRLLHKRLKTLPLKFKPNIKENFTENTSTYIEAGHIVND